eukprot:scaffold200_cov401-Prasinococcus_capsulatus_cf.AAC.3
MLLCGGGRGRLDPCHGISRLVPGCLLRWLQLLGKRAIPVGGSAKLARAVHVVASSAGGARPPLDALRDCRAPPFGATPAHSRSRSCCESPSGAVFE